jgi:UDP-GlcNAc3NAcA epimerase
MLKLSSIVGARPQFIKAAMVSRAIIARNREEGKLLIHEEMIHTGQHYDDCMSDVFFRQMNIPPPSINLRVGSGRHGEATGRMLDQIELELIKRKPDWVLVYGDTNSTLAGALAAAKLHIPVAHVEAGLRSFNRLMPEEINRVLTDHLSSLLFCPTCTAAKNLKSEGITKGVECVGDVMYDAALVFGEIADKESRIIQQLGLTSKEYILATVHRAENTDSIDHLRKIMAALRRLSEEETVVFPVHPRTRHALERFGMEITVVDPLSSGAVRQKSSARSGKVLMTSPVSYVDMVMLEKHAHVILTDSGGVQKEAYFHGVPCVTLRTETEWTETVSAGWNQISGLDIENILNAIALSKKGERIMEYGNGCCAQAVVNHLLMR